MIFGYGKFLQKLFQANRKKYSLAIARLYLVKVLMKCWSVLDKKWQGY